MNTPICRIYVFQIHCGGVVCIPSHYNSSFLSNGKDNYSYDQQSVEKKFLDGNNSN